MNRIKTIRKEKRLTLEQLAEKLRVDTSTIQRLEKGRRKLTLDWMNRISEALGVEPTELITDPSAPLPLGLRLRGEVRAGAWLEIDGQAEADENLPLVSLMPDDRFPGVRQFVLRVVGTSMNKFAAPGDYVVVADWADLGRDLKEDDIIVVRRERGQTQEVTLKRAKRTRKGWELWPDSTDPRHQTPVLLDGDEETETVSVVGLVVGRYTPLN